MNFMEEGLGPNPVLEEIRDEFLEAGGDSDFFKMIANEAVFGFTEIAEYLPGSKRILEIGSGSGLLTAMIANAGYDVVGLEPIGSGFSSHELMLSISSQKLSKPARFVRDKIESFCPEEEFDLIFSVNVFEHIDDWRLALQRAIGMLTEGGKLLIVCPNYNFPYESHFGLPIIFSKELTRRTFSASISSFEKEKLCDGLWESLNFIKYTEVKKFSRQRGYNMHVDKSILNRMVKKLDSDEMFRSRQGLMGNLAQIVFAAKLDVVYTLLPVRFQPYLKMLFTR